MAQRVGNSWPPSWDRIPGPSDESAGLALIHACISRERKMRATLADRWARRGLRDAKRLSRRYLSSDTAKIAWAAKATGRKLGGYGPSGKVSALSVVAIGLTLNALKATTEKVGLKVHEKLSGGTRLLYRFGVREYALQLLSKAAAESLSDLHPRQFMLNGGIPKFERWLSDNLGNAQLVITTDIPACFDSVKFHAVESGLPLPRRVTKERLKTPKERATLPEVLDCKSFTGTKSTFNVGVSSPRRSIPQGAALSSLAAEHVIKEVLNRVEKAHPGVALATYGDNLIALLPQPGLRASVISALTLAIAELFGPDVLDELTRRMTARPPSAGFIFCNRIYALKNVKLRIALPAEAIENFATKTAIAISGLMDSKEAAEFIRLDRSIKGWAFHNSGMPGVTDVAFELYAALKTAEPPSPFID